MRALAFIACLIAPAAALACEFAEPAALEIEANPADVTPPTPPVLSVRKIQRGDEYVDGRGCNGSQSSCDGTGYVQLEVAATDDVSSTLGYQIESPKLAYDGRVLLAPGGTLTLLLGSTDDGDDDLRFTISVAAVDQAGNVSEPSTIDVRDEGEGCQLAHGGAGSVLLALILAMRSALSRRTRGAAGCRS